MFSRRLSQYRVSLHRVMNQWKYLGRKPVENFNKATSRMTTIPYSKAMLLLLLKYMVYKSSL